MTARTHDAFAFAALVTAANYFPPSSINLLSLLGAVIASNIGALLPDIDDAGNRLWDFLPIGEEMGHVLRKVFYKHRTITHSLLGLIGFYELLNWLLPKILNAKFIDPHTVFLGFMIGYISHLMADMLTKEGLPLFFPLKLDIGFPPIKQLRITTGSWVENFIVFPGVLVYLIWFISVNRMNLVAILSKVGS